MFPAQCFVGLDVAKAHRDMALRPTGERWAVANEETGIAARVTRLPTAQPTRMVLEATGGYHRAVVAARAAAALPVVVVQPRPVRDVAKATGQWATTAARAARAVAHCAAAGRRRAHGQTHSLKSCGPSWGGGNALRGGRPRSTASQTRRRACGPPSWRLLPGAINPWRPWLTTWTRRDGQAPSGARATGYRSVPGMGPVCARTLVRDLPALGTFSRQRIAALVGGTPLTRDRGTRRGIGMKLRRSPLPWPSKIEVSSRC
jgi:transposase